MKNLLISVVMPTYNQCQFIGEAIESVLNQSHDNIELIIVDNFSKDGTKEVVNSFQDQRIKFFQFSNKGVIAASRNYGIKKAQGECVAFLDSDDTWYKDKLRKQSNILMDSSDIGLVCCPFNAVDSNGNIKDKIVGSNPLNYHGQCYEELLGCNFITTSSVLLKASVLKTVGIFDESELIVCAEDFDFWLRIVREYAVEYIPECLGDYREHGQNTSACEGKVEKVMYVYKKQYEAGFINLDRFKQVESIYYFRVALSFIGNDIGLVRKFLIKSIKVDFLNVRMLVFVLVGLSASIFPQALASIYKKRKLKNIGSKVF